MKDASNGERCVIAIICTNYSFPELAIASVPTVKSLLLRTMRMVVK